MKILGPRNMGPYIALVVTALLMAFATGYFAFFAKGSRNPTAEDIKNIQNLKSEFIATREPINIVNFNSIYYGQQMYQLVNPNYILPQDGRGDAIYFSSNEGCFTGNTQNVNEFKQRKVKVWEEFRCNRRASLPANFFESPPFIHPSGNSYALLAYKSGRKNFASKEWVFTHLPSFHVTELSLLKKDFGKLGSYWDILSTVNSETLKELSSGKNTIVTPLYVFSRVGGSEGNFTFEYRIYLKSQLDDFLQDTNFTLRSYRHGTSCFYQDGQICWSYSTKHLLSLLNKGSFFILVTMFLVVIIVAYLLISKIRHQRMEDDRRRLAFQVLTHDFRTPISSMILAMEVVQKHLDKLDGPAQEALLHISKDIHRLQRLTETSRKYLHTEKGRQLLNLQMEKIDSINHFVEEYLYPYWEEYGRENIHFEPLEGDLSCEVDTYWLGICLKGIINNAIDHGKFPINVGLCEEKDRLLIQIQDSGQCQFNSLDEMSKEFVKGNKSEGTGLGLNIVRKVMNAMGELRFYPNPTRFILAIKIKNKK